VSLVLCRALPEGLKGTATDYVIKHGLWHLRRTAKNSTGSELIHKHQWDFFQSSMAYNAWLSAAIVHDRELCSDIDPLFVGARYGLAQVCQNLLHEDPDRKTQPLAKNTYGRSALHAAAQMGHSDVSDVLLKHLDDGKVN
jgi:hypothetical protein